MIPRTKVIFLQLCFIIMFNICQAPQAEYGAVSTGEMKDYNYTKCHQLGGYIRLCSSDCGSAQTNVLRCEIAHNYYCLQTQVISTQEDVDALNKLQCVELHADLIINHFHGSDPKRYLQEALSLIRIIKGKLIINQNNFPYDISFDSLTNIGDNVFMGQSPLIQLTNNRVNAIKFPRLQKVHCLKNRKRKCVVVGGNRKPGSTARTELTSHGRNMDASEHFHSVTPVILLDEFEEPEWVTEEEYNMDIKMGKDPGRYHRVNIYERFLLPRILDALLSVFLLLSIFGVIAYAMRRPKSKTIGLISGEQEYEDNWGQELIPLDLT